MNSTIGLLGIGGLLVLLLVRVPVAIGLITVSFLGIAAIVGFMPAFGVVSSGSYDFISSWTLSAIPMFLLMGFVCFHAGLTSGLFTAAKAVFTRIPGALAISSVFACGGFATVCGSSIACAAAMGRVAIPEMVRSGYQANFASGAIAAGGTLGALIPPSIIMILYGILAEVSVIDVFVGGIFAGVATALSYVAVILLIARFRPDIIPPHTTVQAIRRRDAVMEVLPVLLLMFVIFGGMFGGFFTATEAGAVGAAGSLLIAALSRKLTVKILRDSFLETVSTTASIFIISIGAAMFTRFLSLSGAGDVITGIFAGWELSYWELMLIIIFIYLVLGMFMEPLGAMMITLPILIPILNANEISLIWFGVLLTKLLEIGMITPPFGLNVFVVKDVAREYVTLSGVFRGVATFLVADLVIVLLLVAWPEGVLWMTSILR